MGRLPNDDVLIIEVKKMLTDQYATGHIGVRTYVESIDSSLFTQPIEIYYAVVSDDMKYYAAVAMNNNCIYEISGFSDLDEMRKMIEGITDYKGEK